MIATAVRPRLSGESVDNRQLTAVAILGVESAVSSHLSRSWASHSGSRAALEAKIAASAERRRHDRDIREVRAVLTTMIATAVRPRLSGESVDDRQLTAVAILGGATAVSSHLSRSWAGRPPSAHDCRDLGRRTAGAGAALGAKIAASAERRRHDRDSREARVVLTTMIATAVGPRLSGESVDNRQLTAIAILGGATAVSSHLSRSCGSRGPRSARDSRLSDLGRCRGRRNPAAKTGAMSTGPRRHSPTHGPSAAKPPETPPRRSHRGPKSDPCTAHSLIV
jgi:hypothetical protein